jgi:hypothetical protein
MNIQEIMQRIRQISREEAVDAEYMLKTANIESEYDPNATNPASRAAGLFQILPIHRVANVYDPDVNTRWAAKFTLDNKRHLQINGIPVSHETLYLAHQQGKTGAVEIWKGKLTNKQIAQLSPVVQRNMNANNPRKYTSVADWYEFWANKMRNASTEPNSRQPPIAARRNTGNERNPNGASFPNTSQDAQRRAALARQQAEEQRRRATEQAQYGSGYGYGNGDYGNGYGGYGNTGGNEYAYQNTQPEEAGNSNAGAVLLGAAALGGLLFWLLGSKEEPKAQKHVITIDVEKEEYAEAA